MNQFLLLISLKTFLPKKLEKKSGSLIECSKHAYVGRNNGPNDKMIQVRCTICSQVDKRKNYWFLRLMGCKNMQIAIKQHLCDQR